MTSGQETEQVYAYNPGARTGQNLPQISFEDLQHAWIKLNGLKRKPREA